MACRHLCNVFATKKTVPFKKTSRYCRRCDVYMDLKSYKCPCCKLKMQSKPRRNKEQRDKSLYRYG